MVMEGRTIKKVVELLQSPSPYVQQAALHTIGNLIKTSKKEGEVKKEACCDCENTLVGEEMIRFSI